MAGGTLTLTAFARDTLEGLSSKNKYLLPKYFYDDAGSKIFSKIMNMPEYYLTDCEIELFEKQKEEITENLINGNRKLDIIEPGSGDGLKTEYILKSLHKRDIDFRFIPVDISSHANNILADKMRKSIPGISIEPLTGDYFSVMKKLERSSNTSRVILFLGSSIGNFSDKELDNFLTGLNKISTPGDRALIGFDLMKSPEIILPAYNDPYGLTREFNINHLRRINRELGADFNPGYFDHRQEYNTYTGEMKSFLVSRTDHKVTFREPTAEISFLKGERIFMELSRKFSLLTINEMASSHGFRVMKNFTDSRNYFVDSLWIRE